MTIRRTLFMLLMLGAAMQLQAQQSMDFARKFMTLCENDSTVKCITVSPKMMEQIAEISPGEDEDGEQLQQAIAKLRSMRVVSAGAGYYERAEQLLKKHAHRFKAEQEFQTDSVHGVFYTRQDNKGNTVELIMLREAVPDRLTIICLTGDIDKEFLCFLYNKNH